MKNRNEELLWKTASKVIKVIENNDFEAYFVGGCVRDLLLGKPIKDIDIATSAKPDEVMNMFEKTVPTGIEHGTVLVLYEAHSFEVTTFRTEATYSDNRHPDSVHFIRDLKGDIERRDFTINAMAMNVQGEIIDLFNGQLDLSSKLIKTVGMPNERFEEDALRMLRGLRFASQLAFEIDPSTLNSIKKQNYKIKNIAIERIKIEIEKLLQGQDVATGVALLIDSNLLDYMPIFDIAPEMKDILAKIDLPLLNFSSFIAFMYTYNQSISIKKWGKLWKCSKLEIISAQSLTELIKLYKQADITPFFVYKSLNQYDAVENLLYALNLYSNENKLHYEKIRNNLPITSRKEMQIDGKDIIDLYPEKKKGKWISDILDSVEKEIVSGRLNNKKEKIKEWIKCHPPDKN